MLDPLFLLLPLDKLRIVFQVPPMLSTPMNYNCHLESGGASEGFLSWNNLMIWKRRGQFDPIHLPPTLKSISFIS